MFTKPELYAKVSYRSRQISNIRFDSPPETRCFLKNFRFNHHRCSLWFLTRLYRFYPLRRVLYLFRNFHLRSIWFR